ncbi:MAG: hypothetical protein ACI9K2_006810 [Myxococcota bacterium]
MLTPGEPSGLGAVQLRMVVVVLAVACALAEPIQTPAPLPNPVAVQQLTVRTTFPPPYGARRVEGDGFASYLGALRVLPPDTPVRTHDGRVVRRDTRVVDLPLVRGDLQQCADSALRLRAEWLLSAGRPVVFHSTSGDAMPWARYAAGERAVDVGGRLEWESGSPASWDTYLRALFMWAGTASLAERDTVPAVTPLPGDVVVEPGFPGHAVILLDVASDDAHTWVLVGQGYMPAQSFHVEPGPDAGWFLWDDRLELSTWPLDTDRLRRWK